MQRLFKATNKSQASLEKIGDTRRDTSPTASARADNAQSQAGGVQAQAGGAYPLQQQQQQQQQHQHQQYGAPAPAYHQLSASQQQQYSDERYYSDAQQPQQPQYQSQTAAAHPAHVLSRSSSNRLPSGPVPVPGPATANAYQEQQQLQSQRPTINIVNPGLQQAPVPDDDDRHPPGRTQFGPATTIRTSVAKEEKKSRNSGLRGFFSGNKDKKEGRDSPVDHRLSRHGSVLKKGPQQQQAPPSEQSPASPQTQPFVQQGQKPPQSPSQAGGSQTVAAHFHQNLSQEDLHSDERQDERYYQYQRPASRFDLNPQDHRRPSLIDYDEDTPNFPAPPQSQYPQQYQQPYQQPLYHHPNVSQTDFDPPPSDERKGVFSYQGQSTRDRPPAVFQAADESLRPPSQSSLGPPSPLIGPPQPAPRSAPSNPPRYSVQSIQAYQVAQQAANQIQQQPTQNSSPETAQSHPTQGPSQAQQLAPPQEDMVGNRDRDRQRDSRMQDDPDPRYAPQDPRIRMSSAQEQGRSTPPPQRGRDDVQALDHQTLLAKYEELQAKYSKVKRYYFDREAQVTQLQNTVANQRLSMSKTSLDDAQYATRFERLNGAIQNLAFNIRKDWRRVPNWLAPACNRDACATGTKEMTAVGRACISRWLYEHIFQDIFHPGIDPTLSAQLKHMERTLRRSPSILTEEQRDDLLTKVTTWRLTTCEGLQDVLNSRQNEANTDNLAHHLADLLCEYLRTLLNEPAPPNLEGYLLPIVSQTLSIASNLPLESRDVCIEYYWPGQPINETFMKLETGMTPLVNPGSAPTREDYMEEPDVDDEPQSVTSEGEAANVEDQIREAAKQAVSSQNTVPSASARESKKDKKSGSFFSGGFSGALVNKKPAPASSSRTDLPQTKDGNAAGKEGEEKDHAWNFDVLTRGSKEGKIRFAVFLAVEVRGKSAKGLEVGTNGGSGDGKPGNGAQQGAGGNGNGHPSGSATATSGGGTSGVAGLGGVNVLVKAPVFGF